jgi:hypothetical protein
MLELRMQINWTDFSEIWLLECDIIGMKIGAHSVKRREFDLREERGAAYRIVIGRLNGEWLRGRFDMDSEGLDVR